VRASRQVREFPLQNEALESMIQKRNEAGVQPVNKGGTALMTPFAEMPSAEGFYISGGETDG